MAEDPPRHIEVDANGDRAPRGKPHDDQHGHHSSHPSIHDLLLQDPMLLMEEFALQLRRAKRQAKIQVMREIRLQLGRELNSAHNLKRQSELSSSSSSNKGHSQAAIKAAELWQNLFKPSSGQAAAESAKIEEEKKLPPNLPYSDSSSLSDGSAKARISQ